jgi:hypothetical protein
VVDYLGKFLHSQSLQQSMHNNAAAYLTKKALLHASEGAIGRRRPDPLLSTNDTSDKRINEGERLNLTWILNIPSEDKRSVHDDITIAVIFFDHSKGNGKFAKDDAVTILPHNNSIWGTLKNVFSPSVAAPVPASWSKYKELQVQNKVTDK